MANQVSPSFAEFPYVFLSYRAEFPYVSPITEIRHAKFEKFSSYRQPIDRSDSNNKNITALTTFQLQECCNLMIRGTLSRAYQNLP